MRNEFAKWEIKTSVFSGRKPQAGNCWSIWDVPRQWSEPLNASSSHRFSSSSKKSSCLILPLRDEEWDHGNPGADLHGERFQTSTNRQPLAVSATAPPMSHPTLQALAIAAGTGTGMFCRLSESSGSSQICLGSIRWIVK